MYPLRLKPIYDKTIWANDRLTTMRHEAQSGCGTCWEISAHPHAQNKIINGDYAGKTLQELLDEKEREMLGEVPRKRMLRLAFLDAADNLSIQVHPDDAYAHEHENDEGKTESWYILEADEGATLVAGTTIADKEVLYQAVKENTVEQYVRRIPVKAGDFVCIDAGMLHALGKGILALEIGENSNTTYRFYDYNRKDANGNPRPLHIQKSFAVADFALVCTPVHSPLEKVQETKEKMLVEREEFCVKLVDIHASYELIMDHTKFYCLSNVGQDAEIICDGMHIPFLFTESIFVPAACKDLTIQGDTRVLLSYVK